MKNIDIVKNWILEHPEWKYSPKNEEEKKKLIEGDNYFVWNVYLTNEDKRKTLIDGLYNSKNKCRLCWRFPDYSDSMCIHNDFNLNYCHNHTVQWLDMDEDQKITEGMKEKMNEEMEEDIKYRKSVYGSVNEEENKE